MSVAEFILTIIDTVAWPIVFLIGLLIVRGIIYRLPLWPPEPPKVIPPQPIRPLTRDMMETRELKPVPPGVEGYNPSIRQYKEH